MKILLSSLVIFILAFSTSPAVAQKPLKLKHDEAGLFSIGVRSGLALSNSGDRWNVGQGLGLQCRVMPTRHINTEWYFEVLKGGYSENAVRTDGHIGALVLLYPQRKLQRVAPFLAVGPNADYVQLLDRLDLENKVSRWSIGGQAGVGMHINLTHRADLTVSTQYMLHYGNELKLLVEGGDGIEVNLPKAGSSIEGHFLFNISMNFLITDLWKRLRFH